MKRRLKYIAAAAAVALLAAICLSGCTAAQEASSGTEALPSTSSGSLGEADSTLAEPAIAPDGTEALPSTSSGNVGEADPAPSQQEEPAQETPQPAQAGQPSEPAAGGAETPLTCTISIECSTILDNMDKLDPNKAELVPSDGVILAPAAATFYEGESVFNVLQRTCKQNKIHMEFENTPMYESAYIEGIGNLYEFDCGELSGWMYSVNDWYPNFGCSRYTLKDGDVIRWRYTCDLGSDIGGGYAGGN